MKQNMKKTLRTGFGASHSYALHLFFYKQLDFRPRPPNFVLFDPYPTLNYMI